MRKLRSNIGNLWTYVFKKGKKKKKGRSRLGPMLLVHWTQSDCDTCPKMDTCHHLNSKKKK